MGTRGTATASNRRAPVLAGRRKRLCSLLDQHHSPRLTIVVAPAGFGKTVALEAWAASRPDAQVMWLTLSPELDDPERLARRLRRTLRATAGVPAATLILDDFDVLTDPRAVDECAAFIEDAPETLHVVIAARGDLPPRYYRLRLSDDLAEVGAHDLAFTNEEAAELLDESDDLDQLMASTEGWAKGLTLGGDDSGLDKYVMDEVIDRQPQHIRRFLLSTCVLDEMTGSLCDFVMSGSGGQATLEKLEATGMFVTSVGGRSGWFRYHPILRAVLVRRLRASSRDLEQQSSHRAAEWHIARGEVEEGVNYLISAGASDEVVEAAFTHGSAMFDQHRATEVAGWIEHAASSAIEGKADAVLLEAAALHFGGQTHGVREKLDAVEAMPSASPAERLVAELLRSYVALAEGSTTEALHAADAVLHGIEAVDEVDLPNLLGLTGSRADVTAAALVARGVALMNEGRLTAARENLEAVGETSHGIWQASALGALALVEAWSGNLNDGEALAVRALSLADELDHDSPTRTTAWLALAFVARRRDDLARAETLLDTVEETGGTRRRVVALLVATERAHLALARDASAAGRALLAGRWASQHPSLPTALLARRLVVDAVVLISLGELDAAADLLDPGFSGDSADAVSARIRLAVERGDTTRARALLAGWPLDPTPTAIRERQLWTAVLDNLDGLEARACAGMADVVAEAEAEGDIGLFRTAGNAALGPARVLYRSAPTVFLRALVEQHFVAGPPKPARALAEQLTDREYMVLVHLPSRQSNAEIAEKLGVSLNTVKTHLKHIYRKLDVVGRSEAIEAAERLRLL